MEFVKFKRAVHAQFNQLAAGADMLFQDNKVVTMWENLQLDEPYATVARNLDALVKSKPVVDVFITRDYELGIDRNNAYIDSLQGPKVITWNHLYYHMPNQLVYTGFTLEIEHNGEVRQFVYDKPVKHKENVMVAEITYSKSKGIQIRELIPSTSHSSVSLHYFFMLDDCKNPEPVRGFFNEYLNSELTPHRKVFEVLADKMKTPYQEHQLSGLGFSSTMRNSVIVKVDGTFSRTLKVNF